MAEPRHANAQERQANAGDIQALRATLSTPITAVRQTLSTMQSSGIPAQVTFSDGNMTRLLEALATNATTLGVPITGTSREDRFHSLNDWLNASWRNRPGLSGRNRDSPMDTAALDELEMRLNIALGKPSSLATSDQLLAIPVPVQSGTPVVAAVGSAIPIRTGTATTQAITPENAQILEDLSTISQFGRNSAVTRSATTLHDSLEQELGRSSPRQNIINQKLTQARTLIRAELHNAEQRKLAANQAMSVASGQAPSIGPQITTLYQALDQMSSSLTGNAQTLAGQIRRRVPDVWLLGDTEMRQMLSLLQEAKDALSASPANETLATSKLNDANTLFNREQAFYARFLQTYVEPVARAALTEVQGSTLPTRTELVALETRYNRGVPRNERVRFYDIPNTSRTGTANRTVHNEKQDIVNQFQRRVDAVAALRGQTNRISFRMMNDLYNGVRNDSAALHTLVGLWDYANRQGIPTSRDPREVYRSFANAMAVIVDPDLDPFSLYPRAQQLSILGRDPNAPISNTEFQRLASALSQQLRQSRSLTYDYYVYSPPFEAIMDLQQASAEPQLQQLAAIRSLRYSLRFEYIPYPLHIAQDNNPNQVRFQIAKDYLQRTITSVVASGVPETDPVITAARAWLTANQTAPAANQLVGTADELYNISMNLISIREAQLWAANPSFRSSSMSADTVTRANAMIETARNAFVWNYSRNGVDPAFQSNIPRNIADSAIQMLVPSSFNALEAPGMFYTGKGFYNPLMVGVTPAGALATQDEHVRGAAAAEQSFLSYVISMRDNASFAPPASDVALATNNMGTALNSLSMTVGRVQAREHPAVSVVPNATDPASLFPIYDGDIRRWRPIVNPLDNHQMPVDNPLNQDLPNQFHEDTTQYLFGQLYVELQRLSIMHQDNGTPEPLRSLNVAPDQFPIRMRTPFQAQDDRLKTRMQEIARRYNLPTDRPLLASLRDRMIESSTGYASAEPSAQLTQANRLMLAVLDLRIAELQNRLSGNVIITANNQTYSVEDLATRSADDPKIYYITRAREMLQTATRLRDSYNGAVGSDLLSGQVTIRQAIEIAEMGIDSFSPHHIEDVHPPTRPPQPQYIVSASIDVTRMPGNPRRIQFRAVNPMVQVTGGQSIPLDQYERTNGPQNLTYYWAEYQKLGRTDESGNEIQYLLNPRYLEDGQPRYVGQVMRGVRVRMPDNSVQTGDFIVRVRGSHQATTGPAFDPVIETDGTVRYENVLCRVRWRTAGDTQVADPVRDDLFISRMQAEHFLRERQSPVDTVNEYAPTTPALIISPSPTTERR